MNDNKLWAIVLAIPLLIYAVRYQHECDCPPARVPNVERLDRHIVKCPTCDYKWNPDFKRWMYTEGCPEYSKLWEEEYTEGDWRFWPRYGWKKKK